MNLIKKSITYLLIILLKIIIQMYLKL